MSPRNEDKGNYDDTEFPPDSENSDNTPRRPDSREAGSAKRGTTDDEGDYVGPLQPDPAS